MKRRRSTAGISHRPGLSAEPGPVHAPAQARRAQRPGHYGMPQLLHAGPGGGLLAHELTRVVHQAGGGLVQRAPAVTQPACPGYEPGEAEQSAGDSGVLATPVSLLRPDALLVADFGVQSSRLKDTMRRDPELARWLRLAASGPAPSFTVTGHTDCVGDEQENLSLRMARARQVATLVHAQTGLASPADPASAGSHVAANSSRIGRAMNRSAIIRVAHLIPAAAPGSFAAPESVVEMMDMLEDAENLLIDPLLLDRRSRMRLYGGAVVPKNWKPDVAGATRRVDAALAFVGPLVDPANIERHGADSLAATVMNIYYTTDWLQAARASYESFRRLRDQASVVTPELTVEARNLLGFRSRDRLKVLADEALSFELESGSSPKPAPEFSPALRQRLSADPALGKRELRVLAWLRDNKAAVVQAESQFHIDRRAIAAAIAWEAMDNVMRGSPRSAGPGKMHTYSHAWAAIVPLLPRGSALPQQLEEASLVPKPADDDARDAVLRLPQGSITYIAAAMRGAADIAAASGYDITHDLVALTSFYQGHDLQSWRKHMEEKKAKAQRTFVARDPMAVWAQAHVDYLELALGRPAP